MKRFSILSWFLLLALLLSGCINVRQKTVIREDGSGTINLHYWMKSLGDINMGDEVGGFSFIEEEIKKKYASGNTEIKDLKKYNDNVDTTTHIEVVIDFKDFNKLSEAQGFSNIKTTWSKGDDGMIFKYIIPKDTSIKKNYVTSDNKLEYTFEFPNEVISSNGTADGKNTVKWNKLISEHIDSDLEFDAIIKTKNKICGMFGIELPLILILGLFFLNKSYIKKFKK